MKVEITNALRERIESAMIDMYDIRNSLSEDIKKMPKDDDGTDITIGDCINAVISTLEEVESLIGGFGY